MSLGLIIKLGVSLIFLIIIFVIVAALYIAVIAGVDIPGLTGAFRAEGEPLSPETIALAEATERKIDEAIIDKSAFFLELTDAELTALLLTKIDPEAQIRDAKVEVASGKIDLSGHLNGRIAVPFSGSVLLALELGEIRLEIDSLSLGFVPLPGAAKDQLQPIIDEVLDLNELLSRAGATQIQQLDLVDGMATIIGVQTGGATVSALTQEAFLQAIASFGQPTPPVAPGADIVPPGYTGGQQGAELYLALGDSLAANVGASSPLEGYVSRFHSYLERDGGRSLGLLNLGISGESTLSILNGQLATALDEIASRRDDGDSSTKVGVLTLDLGANDLLAHVGSAECQQNPTGNACQIRVDGAIASFEGNFQSIVQRLDAALEDDAEFYIMTMYNPFDFGIGLDIETKSNEIVGRMNAIIRATAESVGAKVADPYPLMAGNAASWTHMLEGDIHPNADGYQTLAFSLTEAQ